MTEQPDTLSLTEARYDTVEIVEVSDHITMIQKDENGDSNIIVMGPAQQEELLRLLQGRKGH